MYETARKKISLLSLFLFIGFTACTSSPPEITGVLDTAFGTSGIMTYTDGMNSYAGTMVKDSSDRYLIAGVHNQNAAVWRYSSEGVLDNTFGTGGLVEFDGGGTIESVSKLLLQSDGKIIAVGFSQNTSSTRSMSIWRLTSSGTLDSSFGTNGIVTYSGGGNYDLAYDGIIDSNNKIVVTGIDNISGNDMAIWRFDINGTPDATFGTGGLAVDGATVSVDNGSHILEDSNGKYLILGSGNSNAVIWRYNSNGTLDTTYGTNGIVEYDYASGYDTLNGAVLGSNDTLTVAGTSSNGTDMDVVLLKYDNTGTLVSSFGTGGVVRYDSSYGYDGPSVLAIDSSGRLLLTGASDNAAGDRDMMIWRYNANGSLDSSFGTNGVVRYDYGTATDERGYDMLIETTGKLMIAGDIYNASDSTDDAALWRYQ